MYRSRPNKRKERKAYSAGCFQNEKNWIKLKITIEENKQTILLRGIFLNLLKFFFNPKL